VVAARTGTFYGQAMTAGDIYTVAGDGTFGFSGDGGPATSAELGSPGAVAVDSAGNLLFSDAPNDRIRMVAARTGTFYGQAMTAGDIYTVAGDGVFGSSGDGGPATQAELYLNDPGGVAVDGAGNLVLSDSTNSRIRVVAASSGTFYGQPMTAGDIYTVAGDGVFGFSGDGGPATSAELSMPQGVAVDAAGNLVVCDGYRVRVVAARTGTFYGQPMTAGDIYTVAGDGVFGFSGDGGPASGAELGHPDSLAVDPAGDLLIADSVNNRIRMVTGGPVARPEHVRTP
jgi:sugar lactone lactonase YvrE